MITCTNCGHANPEGAITCEACYVELPKMSSCPSCHAQVPEDAVFCSQCGASLQGAPAPSLDMATAPTQVNIGQGVPATDVVSFDPPAGVPPAGVPATDVVVPLPDPPAMTPPDQVEITDFPDVDLGFAPTEVTPPGSLPSPRVVEMSEQPTENVIPPSSLPTPPELDFEEPAPPTPPAVSQPPMPPVAEPPMAAAEPPMPPVTEPPMPPVTEPPMPAAMSQPPAPPMEAMPQPPAPPLEVPSSPPPVPAAPPVVSAAPVPTTTPIPEQPKPMPVGATQLQLPVAQLLHERTNSTLDLPTNLNLVHIGKPNDRIPPDIDVSGFPDSDVVSRVHADIRVEPDGYYIEDTGSANGTYVNNQPLRPGDRFRLRAGDRISLGKEDKVSFIFHPG